MATSGEKYVAFDLGAESGRAMLGILADGSLQLQEVHRFANGPVRVLDSLYWDPLRLWQEIKHGLARVSAEHGPDIQGIAVDTWGIDFALVDANGFLLDLPHHYRDSRTEGILEGISRPDLALRTLPAYRLGWFLHQHIVSASRHERPGQPSSRRCPPHPDDARSVQLLVDWPPSHRSDHRRH